MDRIDKAEAVAYIGEDAEVLKGFWSHLPLFIIDTWGEEILPSRRWDERQGHAVIIPGVKPYVKAEISVIDQEGGINHPEDPPVYRALAQIRLSGDPSVQNEKGQFRINLVDSAEQSVEFPFLGMENSAEWELIASVKDPSLIRDYLGFTLASKIFHYSPEARYCEVLFKNDKTFEYRGVYLLAQTVGQGAGKIDFSAGGDAYAGGVLGFFKGLFYRLKDGPAAQAEYIIKRDVYNPEGVTLNTYATREELSAGSLELIYPNENLNGSLISAVEEDITRIEQRLYSKTPVVYVNYPDYIDLDSFVNYYLLNEYLMNYSAGYRSTYMYKAANGKLVIGPNWDNSGSFDNDKFDVDPFQIRMSKAPWFDQMIRDTTFLKRLEVRYSRLQRSMLRDDSMLGLIDNTAHWLESAAARDWKRWGEYYSGSWEHQLIQIKYLLVVHNFILGDEVRKMGWKENLMDSSYSNELSSLMVLGFAVLFVLAVRIGRNH
ncbi:MAG: CotH kinase family protein [Treponema sp.]|nr:CotH kinase family protein [Treponema sp.]